MASPPSREKKVKMAIPSYDALGIGGSQARRGVTHRRNHLDMASHRSAQNRPAERFSRFAGLSVSLRSPNSHSIGENLLFLKLLETVTLSDALKRGDPGGTRTPNTQFRSLSAWLHSHPVRSVHPILMRYVSTAIPTNP